jgi:hypothetical protein
MQTRTPRRAEHTSTRIDCGGRMDAPLASARGCFAWWAPVGIPTCYLKRSPGKRRLSGDGERGEEIISISSSSSPSSSLALEDPNSDRVPPPTRRALATTRAELLSCLLCFRTRCLSLSARLASHLTTSSGKVTPPPRGSLRTHPRPCT